MQICPLHGNPHLICWWHCPASQKVAYSTPGGNNVIYHWPKNCACPHCALDSNQLLTEMTAKHVCWGATPPGALMCLFWPEIEKLCLSLWTVGQLSLQSRLDVSKMTRHAVWLLWHIVHTLHTARQELHCTALCFLLYMRWERSLISIERITFHGTHTDLWSCQIIIVVSTNNNETEGFCIT